MALMFVINGLKYNLTTRQFSCLPPNTPHPFLCLAASYSRPYDKSLNRHGQILFPQEGSWSGMKIAYSLIH